jgi:hypothetical protein
MNEKTSAAYMVVLEEGAAWPKWIAEYLRSAVNSVVVAYAPGESTSEFTARVKRRLAELTTELRIAILACSPRAEVEHLAGREEICHALLAAMNPRGRGEVVLAASVEGSEDAKHAIFDLAGALCDGLRGSERLVRVRFSSGRPESGIMASPAAAVPRSEHPAYHAISTRRR